VINECGSSNERNQGVEKIITEEKIRIKPLL